jgi:hypothetical protein
MRGIAAELEKRKVPDAARWRMARTTRQAYRREVGCWDVTAMARG